jgi:CRP-like cAMP-binding protein
VADLRALKDEAAALAAEGRLDRAAEVYRAILAADGTDVGSRLRLAEVLRRAGHAAEAIAAYRAVADRFARDGFLAKAIAVSKSILELDPSHVGTQASLATLYARRDVPRRARAASAPGRGVEPRGGAPIPLGPGPATPLEEIAAAAAPLADEEETVFAFEPSAGPSAPPAVPIFSDLSPETFVALAAGVVLRRFEAGEAILREGEAGASFYVVATGRVAVSRRDADGRDVVLARLGEGDFFGEMALLTGAPRSATVAADGAVEALELRPETLRDLAARHPQLAAALRRFYRLRLLANAMALSPVFRPFARRDRKLVMGRFREREVAAGEVVVREGDPSDGLYVVLGGEADVLKRRGGGEIEVGRLREGDLFGEMSCLHKRPATATVRMRRGGTLLRLPRSAFDALVVTHPQILEVVADLADERAGSLDAILAGHAQWTEDGLVLV